MEEKCVAQLKGLLKNLKRVWWNDEVKSAVRRKEDAWKEVLAANDEEAKRRYTET